MTIKKLKSLLTGNYSVEDLNTILALNCDWSKIRDLNFLTFDDFIALCIYCGKN